MLVLSQTESIDNYIESGRVAFTNMEVKSLISSNNGDKKDSVFGGVGGIEDGLLSKCIQFISHILDT